MKMNLVGKSSKAGMRITPSTVEFHDAETNVVHQMTMSVQNLAKTSKRIRFHAPATERFQLRCKQIDQVIAPGLEVTALVEYFNTKEEDCLDRIVLSVDEELVEIPIKAFSPKPAMEITGPVDFGTLVADGKVLRKEIAILNRGSKSGEFRLKYAWNEPFTIIPMKGVVKAGYSQPIRFEFVSKKVGNVDERVGVYLEGQPPSDVKVTANVALRSLRLLSVETEGDITCIEFGPTYYGTDVVESCLLCNDSPDEVSFVVILEEDGEGQEIAVDLSKTTSGVLFETRSGIPEKVDLTSLVTASPTQGTLKPYEKRPVHFKFSPRGEKSSTGWAATEKPLPRRDYALFVHIDMVGSMNTFSNKSSHQLPQAPRVEVAVTGTALPVFLSIIPSSSLSFGDCPVGNHVDRYVTLRNDSPDLPILFSLPKLAHFHPFPSSGIIDHNENIEVLVSFRPNQIGQFKPVLNVDVIGYICELTADPRKSPKLKETVIYKYFLQLDGKSLPVLGQRTAKSLTAQGRLYPEPGIPEEIRMVESKDDASMRVFTSSTSPLKMLSTSGSFGNGRKSRGTGQQIVIAEPNDRATSIRPSNRKEKIISKFTKTERYSYVDPDYGYTDEEELERQEHRQKYIDYIQSLRKVHLDKAKALEFEQLNNQVDIGIKSGRGLRPTKLRISEAEQYQVQDTSSNKVRPEEKLLSSKSLENRKSATARKKISEGLKAVPMTADERIQCEKTLTPEELYQVIIEPKVIDFGEVCSKSLASKELKITNNLKSHIHIQVEIDCRELRQTSPLSQIVPPGCVAKLEFLFESNTFGKFERSVSYTVNRKHKGHLVVLAEVVTVALSLSTDHIVLSPSGSLPADAGMRGLVTLHNNRNMAAEFSWAPVVGKDGTAFSVRPARGSVNPFSSLACEVVFYPSYYATLTGQFFMQVEGGNQLQMRCQAELGPTTCSFVEHRLMFGAVPLNLAITRSAFLKNASQNHAYFKVVDPSPIAGMTILPKEGFVPVGGTTELRVAYKPQTVQKFDTFVEVEIRGWKVISLRMGGHVEPPCVDVDLDSFQYGGVYCGAKAVIEFRLANLARSRAIVEFDLVTQKDFTLNFLASESPSVHFKEMDGIYQIALNGQQQILCALEFNPLEVASYDFIIPVSINNTVAPSPPASPYPASLAPSRSAHTLAEAENYESERNSRIPTPSRRVQATALRPPLQISQTELHFHLPSGYYDLGIESAAGRSQGILFVNNSNQKLEWVLDILNSESHLQNGTFRFIRRSGLPYSASGDSFEGEVVPPVCLDSGETFHIGVLFCPPEPGVYEANIPLILNNDFEHPYRVLRLTGEFEAPIVVFEPEIIHFTPVPLKTSTSVEFNIIAKGYRRARSLKCQIPEVELEDGSNLTVLEVSFPNGQVVQPCCHDAGEKEPFVLPCVISFSSPRPVSFNSVVYFEDGSKRFELPIIATADNCLLTCYNFLASHQSDYHVVCENIAANQNPVDSKDDIKERVSYGQAHFVPCISAIRPPTNTSSVTTTTSFGLTTSTYQESATATTSSYPRTPPAANSNDGEEPELISPYDAYEAEDPFAASETEEEKYLREVLRTVQRWFSCQGWSSGPCPIVLPHSLRSGFSTDVDDGNTTRAGSWSRERKKETKTIFDIVSHLCGKAVPGIPQNISMPNDLIERLKQLHWMYATLLTFLRCQGAMVSSIKPEFLLTNLDYDRWLNLEEQIEGFQSTSPIVDMKQSRENLLKEQERYELISRRAWTDVLLQTIKVLILNRITPQNYKKTVLPEKYPPLPNVSQDPLSSNVYNVGERIILAWVNHHFEQQLGSSIWKYSINGKAPSSRWIVNFDNDFLDGLVFASLLAAYTPFLVPSHLHSLYTYPSTAEQCLHNALIVVEALRYLGVDYDVLATDITEPNPVGILLFCIYLFRRLPQYLPRATVDFVGPLHSTVSKHVRLQNPSSKPLTYHVVLAGDYASDFTVPMGDSVRVPPKGQIQLPVEHKSRFLRACSATLILVGKRAGSSVGSTLVFNLQTSVDTIIPLGTVKCESPCYELNKVQLEVSNPFSQAGDFKVVLVETKQSISGNTLSPRTSKRRKNLKKVESRTDHGLKKKSLLPKTEETMFDPKNESKRIEKETASYPNILGLVAVCEKVDNQKDAVIAARKSEMGEDLAKRFKSTSRVLLSSFWCPHEEVHLEPYGEANVEVLFLPFQLGSRQCSVLFLNEKVGEFLYSVEAEGVLPPPSHLPYQPTARSVRISSATAAERSKGLFGGDDRVVYWQCEVDQSVTEEILLPASNIAKENALITVAEQRMSERELRRRKVTGIISSTTVTQAMATLGLSEDSITLLPSFISDVSGMLSFSVEGNSKFFKLPKSIDVPVVLDKKAASRETVKLPITFVPSGPGHYPCRIILRSHNDIRVYQIECTVNPEGSSVEIEFTSPTHESVTQDVPVENRSDRDWDLIARVEGEGFSGASRFFVKSRTIGNYPLLFKPIYEGYIEGKLTLINRVNGTESSYLLKGQGTKPLQLDDVILECEAKKTTTHILEIPNFTGKKMVFQAFSDSDLIYGPPFISVLPSQTNQFPISVTPWKRGTFSAVVSFVSDDVLTKQLGLDRVEDSDSDDEEISMCQSSRNVSRSTSQLPDLSLTESQLTKPYRVWYSLTIKATPPPPEKSFELTCAAHTSATMEILVTNPSRSMLELDVIIEGEGLSGPTSLTLDPTLSSAYRVIYEPARVGRYSGRVIFQNKSVGEFWYNIALTATTPPPRELPLMQCPLGRECHQMIRVDNPTTLPVTFKVYCSNRINFRLDLHNQQILLPPNANMEVPVAFSPSALGYANHKADIVFKSEQLGELVYIVSGDGLAPVPSDDHVIKSSLGSSSSIIIPFQNPFEEDIGVDITLQERPFSRSRFLFESALDRNKHKDLAFSLLLKQKTDVFLSPKGILDIPICFAPEAMILHEATCFVHVRKTDGSGFDGYDRRPSYSSNREMRWVFTIKGVPESRPVKDARAPILQCKARERLEEKLELCFTGINPSISKSTHTPYIRSMAPMNLLGGYLVPSTPDLDVDYVNLPEEFKYEFEYASTEGQMALERSVGLGLIRKMKHKISGIVTLIFNVVFSPFKPFDHLVHLVITANSGGVWTFPIRFMATEPSADDVIEIEAARLNKDSTVGFRMTSQIDRPLPFEAFFTKGMDPVFTVTPSSGELPPIGSDGLLLRVIYTPTFYGKMHRNKLIIQTPSMQWTYDVHGRLPEYQPPAKEFLSSEKKFAATQAKLKKKNYVRDNLRLSNTAASSPLKGAPLVERSMLVAKSGNLGMSKNTDSSICNKGNYYPSPSSSSVMSGSKTACEEDDVGENLQGAFKRMISV